ncbi:MAG: tRNA-dihydrouridine synthase, partial [Lactobacillales bacterium]|nr:tRNA-dihydrouridine synthase [Lactobacillales bacterium]
TEVFLRTGELLPKPSIEEKIKMAKIHLEKLVQLKGEKIGIRQFRQLAAYYLKGTPQATKVKVAINQAKSKEEAVSLLDEFAEKRVHKVRNDKSL